MKRFMIIALPLMLSACIDTGDGNKVGSVLKLARQGVFCKTWEGQIQRGGLSNGSGATGAAFNFTIEDNPELVKKVQHYMDTQQEVKITYRSEAITFCRSESDGHFLTGIDPLDKTADRPLKLDTEKALPVAVVPAEQSETRDDKIMRLLKTQQELINELATKR